MQPVVWTEAAPDRWHVICCWCVRCGITICAADFMRWIDAVSSRMPVLNPPETIRWNMEKAYLRQIETRVPRCRNDLSG